MSDSSMAMSTWIGALSSGGVLRGELEEAGVTVAAYVVGEDRLSELREWMVQQPKDVIAREQVAAIQVCIWMANADRNLDPEESHLLQQIIMNSGLDADTQDQLVTEVHDPPSLEGLEERLTHPVLRELLLGLSWELAYSPDFFLLTTTFTYGKQASKHYHTLLAGGLWPVLTRSGTS